jgi:SAM-dependent methyltransferase
MTTRADEAVAFGAVALDYDRFRVGPPPEIVDLIAPSSCETVLDLAAGTGALTRQLVGRYATVIAVDPDKRMRDVLVENCPSVDVLDGTAEEIPLPDGFVDAVMVASAWHWVDPELAIPEIARVLRPEGTLAITWSRRDRGVPWVADLEAFRVRVTHSRDWIEGRIREVLDKPWLPDDAPFTDVEVVSHPWTVELTRNQIVGLMTTYNSFIDTPDEDKPELLRQFAEYVHDDFRLDHQDLVQVPMLTHLWRARLR